MGLTPLSKLILEAHQRLQIVAAQIEDELDINNLLVSIETEGEGIISISFLFGPYRSSKIVYSCRLERFILREDSKKRVIDATKVSRSSNIDFVDALKKIFDVEGKMGDLIRRG